MTQNVPTENALRLKKSYQVSFRRWLMNKSGGGRISKYIGSDFASVRKYVEGRFVEEMNWSNYAEIWVIDHIVPVRLFDLTEEEDLKIVWHYKNIVPLLIKDNLYKEGALEFSLKLLETIPQCEIVEKLRQRILPESKRLDKYLIHHEQRK